MDEAGGWVDDEEVEEVEEGEEAEVGEVQALLVAVVRAEDGCVLHCDDVL